MPPKPAPVADTNNDEAQQSLAEKTAFERDMALKELELKKEQNEKLKIQNVDLRNKVKELEEQIQIKNKDRIDLTSDMGRQYKSMQSELQARIRNLEKDLSMVAAKLETCLQTIQQQKHEFNIAIVEKDSVIEHKDQKMALMGQEFDKSLNEVVYRMTSKLNSLAKRWEESEEVGLSEESRKRLADFHLNKISI